jgi:hypothetical protein
MNEPPRGRGTSHRKDHQPATPQLPKALLMLRLMLPLLLLLQQRQHPAWKTST